MKPSNDRPAIVYVATNDVSGDKYIGLTCQTFPNRKAKHRWSALIQNSQTHFHRAIRKYGWDSFVFEILSSHDTYDAAKAEEVRLIASLEPQYNMTAGGDGAPGWKPTKEQIEKAASKRRGKPGPWTGKALPQSFFSGRDKWSRSAEGIASWERCRAMGPKSSQKRVVCLDDGKIYESIEAAASAYGTHSAMVSAICKKNGKRVTAAGKVFRFYGEHYGGEDEAREVKARSFANQRKGRPLGTCGKPVICLETGQVFPTVRSAAEYHSVSSCTVIVSCKRRHKYHTKNSGKFAYVTDAVVT